jgi:DNA-binding response OmpR family regulator
MKTLLLVTGEESLQKELDEIASGQFESLRVSNEIDGLILALMIRPAAVLVDTDSLRIKEEKFSSTITKHKGFQSIPVFFISNNSQVSEEIKNLSNFKGLLQKPLDPEEIRSRIASLSHPLVSPLPSWERGTGGEGESPSETKTGSPPDSAVKKDSSAIKILSVDDSSVVRKLVSMILTAEGFKVITASDGLDGINKAREIMPDLILLDFVMPRMNGFQVCRLLQKDEQLKHIPVILVTSKGDKVGDKFVSELGVTGYITKPFQPEELITKIRQTLESHNTQKASLMPAIATSSQQAVEGSPTAESQISLHPSIDGAKAPETPVTIPSAQQNIQVLVQEELNKWLASGDLEAKIEKIIEARLSKVFQEKILKQIEKLIQDRVKGVQDKVDKIIEFIRKSKQ